MSYIHEASAVVELIFS